MYKKHLKQLRLAGTIVVSTMMFSGCGGSSDTIQSQIDTAQFDKVIGDLEAKSNKDQVDYYNLASAYMGKAGFAASDVVSILLKVNEESGNNSSYGSFLTQIEQKKGNDPLLNLSKASQNFINAGADKATCNQPNKTTLQENGCLYIGLSDLYRSATTVTYLTKDITKFTDAINNSTGETPLDMKVSMDALEWATTTNNPLSNASTVTSSPVTFTFEGQSYTYTHLNMSLSGKTFYRLATSSNHQLTDSTIITDGYCDSNYDKTPCSNIEDSDGSIKDTTKTCYACPVSLTDKNATSTSQALVDILNSGTDTITSVSNDPTIKDEVVKIKNEMTNNSGQDVTITDVINYFNNQN